MRIIRNFSACPDSCKGAVLALGNFDGVHLGHRAIFNHCAALAKAEGRKAAAMTFEPHPRQFFAKDHAPMRIYPFRCKASLIAENGIDVLFSARFNQKLASTSAQSFISDILYKQLGVAHVVTGYNFAFGKGRQGNTDMLSHMAQALGFGFTAHPPVHDAEGAVISSSGIRGFLQAGDMASAGAQLGRPYRIGGRVQKGQQRGRTLGFPTANLSLSDLLKPRFGIYAVRIQIGETWHDGVASIGVNPTFSLVDPVLEVHVFDMERDLYGEYVRVEPVQFLREEKQFKDAETLKAQMAEDCKKAQDILASRPLSAI